MVITKLKELFRWPKTNIYDEIEIFFELYRYLNLLQFRTRKIRIDHNHYKRYVEAKLWEWTMFYFAICSYIFLVYQHVRGETLFKTDSQIFNYGNQLFLVAVYSLSIFTTTNNMILRVPFWDMVVHLHTVDLQMETINFRVNHNIEYLILSASFGLCIMYVTAIGIYLTWTGNFTWIQIVFETYPVLLYYFLLSMCYGIVILYVFRFIMLNRAMKHYFIVSWKVGAKLEPKLNGIDNYFDLILAIRRIYADLTNAMDTVNLCLSQHLMFCTGVSFIFSLLTWFSAYCVYFLDSSESTEDIVIFIFLLNWSIIYVLLLTLGCGEVLKVEGLKTLKLINVAIINAERDNALRYEMIKFSQQIRHKHPVFTCGLFPFDLTLINSITGGLVSYLIILIQFQTTNMV